MIAILSAVSSVLAGFTFLRHFASITGYVLKFSACVGDDVVVGVGIIEFDEQGNITDFMVVIPHADVILTSPAEAEKRLSVAHL